MRWPIFAIFTYLAACLHVGLAHLWSVGGVRPSLLLVLMAYVATWAPPVTALWAALWLGLIVDLLAPVAVGATVDAAVVGPAALGYVLGAWVILALRPMVFRTSPVAIATLAFLAGLAAMLLSTLLLWARGLPFVPGQPIPGWGMADALFAGFLQVVYSGLLAWPIAYLLLRTEPLWGFEALTRSERRRFAR